MPKSELPDSADAHKIICYVTASYPYGPGEAFVGTEIKAWLARDQNILVVPTYIRGTRDDDLGSRVPVFSCPMFAVRFVIAMMYWLVKSPGPSTRVVLNSFRSWRNVFKNVLVTVKAFEIARRLKATPCCHIHAHWGGTSSTMAMAISDLTNIPWSMTCHRWDIYANNSLRLKSRSAKFVRFISERGKRDGIKLGVHKDSAQVIHMGVEHVANMPVKRAVSGAPVIACPANLIEIKGHRYLLAALGMCHRRGVHAVLRLYGDGGLRESLRNRCAELGLVESVTFEGHVSHTELIGAYERGEVDLVVLPSLDLGEGEHEGIPVSLMEAMGFGIPVVSTSTGSIPELLTPNLGLTVPDRDADALADKIIELLSDAVRYRKATTDVLDVMNSEWTIDATVDALEAAIFDERFGLDK